VKAFVERGHADAHCRQLNLQKRGNPFRYTPEATSGSFFDQYTTMGEAAFLALVRAEGLTPPSQDSAAAYDDTRRGLRTKAS
jgi:hypothetical protein